MSWLPAFRRSDEGASSTVASSSSPPPPSPPPPSPPPPSPPPPSPPPPSQRPPPPPSLSTAPDEKWPGVAVPLAGFGLGFVSGLYHAANRSSLVFMAENAHRRPDTVQGWYFYNKTKNYKVLLAGVSGGLRVGTKTALWTLPFVVVEHGVTKLLADQYHSAGLSRPTWAASLSGSVAGLTTVAAVGLLYPLPRAVALRMVLPGVLVGGFVGACRDFQALIRQRTETSAAQ